MTNLNPNSNTILGANVIVDVNAEFLNRCFSLIHLKLKKFVRPKMEPVKETISSVINPVLYQAQDNFESDSDTLDEDQSEINPESGSEFLWEIPSFAAQTLPAAVKLAEQFQLSPFEFWVLILCAADELDAAISKQLHRITHRSGLRWDWLTRLIPGAHWSATSLESPLRRFHLLELRGGEAWLQGRLGIPERVLHYLLGRNTSESMLEPFLLQRGVSKPSSPVTSTSINSTTKSPVNPENPSTDLSENRADEKSFQRRSLGIIRWLRGEEGGGKALWLSSESTTSTLDLLHRCIHMQNVHVAHLDASLLSQDRFSLLRFLQILQRETLLEHVIFCIDLSESIELTQDKNNQGQSSQEQVSQGQLAFFLNRCGDGIVILARSEPQVPEYSKQSIHCIEVPPLSRLEQAELWKSQVPIHSLNGSLTRLLSSFPLSAEQIKIIGRQINDQFRDTKSTTDPTNSTNTIITNTIESPIASKKSIEEQIWHLARLSCRSPSVSGMARLEAKASWNDLVVPEATLSSLQALCSQVKHRHQVYENWGFEKKSSRGLGIASLFHGPSGTGKTLAAEVVAKELGLDLCMVDLSRVVSKYIGETEKNLSKVFDAAQSSGCVLFFDEADALFGKRSEVKDSHDRYANIEVSYLLQRVESYSGLTILTSNLKDSIDEAFLRRVRFSLHFPFPDASLRKGIWKAVFPPELPREDLPFDKLSQLNISGGSIRNIAVNAAFVAAQEEAEAVTLKHIEKAAKLEYQKMEKPLTEAELRGWAA